MRFTTLAIAFFACALVVSGSVIREKRQCGCAQPQQSQCSCQQVQQTQSCSCQSAPVQQQAPSCSCAQPQQTQTVQVQATQCAPACQQSCTQQCQSSPSVSQCQPQCQQQCQSQCAPMYNPPTTTTTTQAPVVQYQQCQPVCQQQCQATCVQQQQPAAQCQPQCQQQCNVACDAPSTTTQAPQVIQIQLEIQQAQAQCQPQCQQQCQDSCVQQQQPANQCDSACNTQCSDICQQTAQATQQVYNQNTNTQMYNPYNNNNQNANCAPACQPACDNSCTSQQAQPVYQQAQPVYQQQAQPTYQVQSTAAPMYDPYNNNNNQGSNNCAPACQPACDNSCTQQAQPMYQPYDTTTQAPAQQAVIQIVLQTSVAQSAQCAPQCEQSCQQQCVQQQQPAAQCQTACQSSCSNSCQAAQPATQACQQTQQNSCSCQANYSPCGNGQCCRRNHVKFISKMADVIADHGHNVTLFQPFHIAMKNLEGLVKNKNIEIINYYPDHYEDLLKSEVQTFPEFWDSRLVNNSFLSSFMISKILTDEFAKTGTQLYLLPDSLDVTFIWKYEKDDTEFKKRVPKNVHLKKWVPQTDLLADKRVNVFMKHGELGSTMEVAYSAKSALMVPISEDQPKNALMLALPYDKFELQDGEKLTRKMKEMVTNTKYQKKAQELLDVLSNQPIDIKMSLMKHLEFAIQFPNLRSQVPEIYQVGLIAHYYLDVVMFLAFYSALAS
ncbi:hypothetical protein L5515_007381 [Caenorhabditis briggsae]|uniref:glucuronosyltransferase n=1 Tax=Caenorhabditis briggsae TaxID=6238 RepID=A0AAE9F4Y6_CAEBR|nr:hypothetical protein L5515_007381 [Caenorhabditis briggsae]